MFDIAQAAIGMDGSAPCEIIPKGYNGQQYMTYKYKTGVVMTEQPYLEDNPGAQGIKFIGTKGWIEVARGYIACSDPSLIPAEIAGTRPQPRAQRPAGQQGQRPAGASGQHVRPRHRQDCSLRSAHLTCRISSMQSVHARNLSLQLRSDAVLQ